MGSRAAIAILSAASVCLGPFPALAEKPATAAAAAPDRLAVHISSETFLRLFRYAPLPGPPGAAVEPAFSSPLYEYAALRIDDVDTPWQKDSIDIELATWGMVNPAKAAQDGAYFLDGDLQIANVAHQYGPAYIKVGRQVHVGGTNRLLRLDGLSGGVTTPWGFVVSGYGGWVVLPRWAEQPGYHRLEATEQQQSLHSPEAIAEPRRDGHWLAGGRLQYSYLPWLRIGAAFHEQRANGELDRRDVGLDLQSTPHDILALSGSAVVDVDGAGVADARGAVDVFPIKRVALSGEYRYSTPALLLSRQSVLSVFSTDAFHEAGALASYRPIDELKLGLGGFADVFADSLGARLRVLGRLCLGPWVMRAEYSWLREPINGYHAPRLSIQVHPGETVTLTAEGYVYVYEQPIRDTDYSLVGVASGSWAVAEGWSVLAGGSVARTPYAALEAQALARLQVDLSWGDL